MTEEINVFSCLDYIRDNSKAYAQAKANRIQLEELRKTIKAKMMIAAELGGSESAAKQERDAYASEEYKTLLDGLKAAVEEEEKLRWLLEAARLKVEVYRTIQANQRAIDKNL